MSERVAVYIDFDNVVISRYDDVHGKGAWRRDEALNHRPSSNAKDESIRPHTDETAPGPRFIHERI